MQSAVVDESLAEQASVYSCLANVGVTVGRYIKRIASLFRSIGKGGRCSSPRWHVCRWFSEMKKIQITMQAGCDGTIICSLFVDVPRSTFCELWHRTVMWYVHRIY